MLRLFLRLYLLLMLPATVAFVFLMYTTDQVMAQMHAEQQRQRAGVAFDRAERIVTDQRVPDARGRLREIAFRDRPGGGTVYLRRIKDSDRALRIEWVGSYEYMMLYYTIIVVLVTTAMAAIPWRWTRPLWRELEGLNAATAREGEGDFGVRAQIGESSLLHPIATAFNVKAGRVQALLQSHRRRLGGRPPVHWAILARGSGKLLCRPSPRRAAPRFICNRQRPPPENALSDPP